MKTSVLVNGEVNQVSYGAYKNKKLAKKVSDKIIETNAYLKSCGVTIENSATEVDYYEEDSDVPILNE